MASAKEVIQRLEEPIKQYHRRLAKDFERLIEIFGEAAVATEPAECPFDDPTPWNNLEAFGMRRLLDNLQSESGAFMRLDPLMRQRAELLDITRQSHAGM